MTDLATANKADGTTAAVGEKRGREKRGRDEQISRAMSYVLRHGAVKEGLPIREDGTLSVDELLTYKKLKGVKLADVQRVVEANDKQRFQLLQDEGKDEWRIRANQGHSLRLAGVQESMEELDDAACASYHFIHGTYERHWTSIEAEGLKRMNRDHVHMALVRREDNGGDTSDLPVDIDLLSRAGIRRGCEILVFVDAIRARAMGCRFYRSANDVGLSDGIEGVVPSTAFVRAVRRRDGAVLYPTIN